MIKIKIFFKCHKTTLFLGFVFYYIKLKKRREFMNEIKEHTEKIFEDIKHIDEYGNEYWYARELASSI